MNTKIKLLAGLVIAAMVPTVAMAHTDVSIGLNLGVPVYGGYYEPAPRVYYREAAPVIYGPSVRYEVRGAYCDGERYEHHRDWDHGWRRDWDHDRRRWDHDGYRDRDDWDHDRR